MAVQVALSRYVQICATESVSHCHTRPILSLAGYPRRRTWRDRLTQRRITKFFPPDENSHPLGSLNMKSSHRVMRRFLASVALSVLASSIAHADDLGQPISLRSSQSDKSTLVEAADASSESWMTEAPKFRPVANWISMSQAQAGLPQGYYAGAELFFARASVNTSGTFATGANFNGGTDPNVQVHNFIFDYQSSPKLYVGWRSPNTGDALQFSYWHYDNLSTQSTTITDPNQAFVLIGGLNGDNQAPFMTPGDTITAYSTVNFNVYDAEYFKSLAFAGGRWLVTGSAGARIADINLNTWSDLAGIDQSGGGPGFFVAGTFGNRVKFVGAGPRLTAEARRNIGAWFSLYARGGYAILLGSSQSHAYQTDVSSGGSFNARSNGTGTVSVVDCELGASWRASDFLVLSTGYMFQSWQGITRSIGQSPVTAGSDFISFDGFVARAVLNY